MKRNRVTHWCAALAATFALCAAVAPSHAELPPGTYEKLKKNASEVLTIRILKIETPEGRVGHFQVFFTAKVLGVTRSKSGVKIGQTLRIASYHVTEEARKQGFVGPRIPPLLPGGWEGKAYLNKKQDKKLFDLAAYGESFEATKKKSSKN